MSKYGSDSIVANQLQNKSSQVTVYHSKGEPEPIKLLQSEYSDQISELIVDHLLEKYELKKTETEGKASESKEKEKSVTKKNEEEKNNDKQDVESEGKYELHISNISLKATESDLRKLFETYGEIYRVKLIKRSTMQKAFIDMDNEKSAQLCIDALDGYDLHSQQLEVKFSDADTAKSYP